MSAIAVSCIFSIAISRTTSISELKEPNLVTRWSNLIMSAQFESLKLAGHTIQDTFLSHNPYPRGQWIAVVHSSNALFGESQQRVHIQVKVSKYVRSSVSECVVRHDLGWTEVWSPWPGNVYRG